MQDAGVTVEVPDRGEISSCSPKGSSNPRSWFQQSISSWCIDTSISQRSLHSALDSAARLLKPWKSPAISSSSCRSSNPSGGMMKAWSRSKGDSLQQPTRASSTGSSPLTMGSGAASGSAASMALVARGSVPWEKPQHSGTRLTWPLASSSWIFRSMSQTAPWRLSPTWESSDPKLTKASSADASGESCSSKMSGVLMSSNSCFILRSTSHI
mmetsp:Transcript_71421/g.209695  ORF Transcript_71421/g.209695 Transcript_71421/m.209695 type:complete len:212 (+) Transcript_71421:319-954(+)